MQRELSLIWCPNHVPKAVLDGRRQLLAVVGKAKVLHQKCQFGWDVDGASCRHFSLGLCGVVLIQPAWC